MKCTWRSQPMINNTGTGNSLLPEAMLYTGNTFKRILEMFDSINIPHFSRTLFYSIQKTLLFPTLNSFYKRYRSKIINICTTREENNFIGDGRSDLPGCSAKYGTYSLMSTDLNKIVDFFVVHVSTAGNSSRMEKKGLQTLLEKYSNSIKVTTLTTDRHVQIWSFLSKEYPEILHQFDVWHFWKSVKKTSEIEKTVSRWVYGLRQLLIMFGGTVLVQLTMKNWSGKNGSVCWTIFGVFTLGKIINYFTSVNTDNWTKNGNDSKPIHHRF